MTRAGLRVALPALLGLMMPQGATAAGSSAPADTRQCVSAGSFGRIVPFGRDRVIVRDGPGRGGWVSRFRGGDCPGLEELSTLIVDVHGGQYCSGDHVRTLRPGETIPGPVCLLGPFERYEEPARAAKSRR